jgi:hypothetical protein
MGMRNIALLLVVAGAVIYYIENKDNKYLFPSIENNLPGPIGLDVVLMVAGAGMLFFG